MTEPRKIKKKKLKDLVNQLQIKGCADECKKAVLLLNENEVEEGGTILKETKTNIKSRQRRRSTGKQSARKWKNLSNRIQIISEETPEEELCVAMATTGINTEPISNSMDMIQEIKNMEARLNASLKKKTREQELKYMETLLTKNMKTIIESSFKEAMQNMTMTVTTLVRADPVILKNCSEISNLKEENAQLNKQVQYLSSEHGKLNKRMNNMEQKTFYCSLIIWGIKEETNENEQNSRYWIYNELAHTLVGVTGEIKLAAAKQMKIKSCRMLGRYSRTRPRPYSVPWETRCGIHPREQKLSSGRHIFRPWICVEGLLTEFRRTAKLCHQMVPFA